MLQFIFACTYYVASARNNKIPILCTNFRIFRTLCKTFPLFYLGIEEACFSGWDWKSLENKESCRSEVRVVKAFMFGEFRNSLNSNLQHCTAVCLFVGQSATIAICIFDFQFKASLKSRSLWHVILAWYSSCPLGALWEEIY